MTAPSLAPAKAGAWSREPRTVVRRTGTLPAGAPLSQVILSESEVAGVPVEWEPHSHSVHELVWVRGGMLTARVGDQVFTVSEGVGLWLPAGVVHSGRLTANVEFFDAVFVPDRTPLAFELPTVIAMTPVLGSLLGYLSNADLDAGARARAEAVVFDVLEPSQRPLTLQVPGDDRIDAIARALLADPADSRNLDDWSVALGLSERTIGRAFRHTTGLSFAQWRQTLRVHEALTLLAEGHEVFAISERLGYAQTSTFISAFRRVMGTTPGAFRGADGVDELSETPYSLS